MSIKITGLDELQRKLKMLAEKAQAVNGEHSVPISELLSPAFMATCTLFNSSDEMFEQSGFKVRSQSDFEAIPDEKWDTFIRENTSFYCWAEMLRAAGTVWTKEKMGF